MIAIHASTEAVALIVSAVLLYVAAPAPVVASAGLALLTLATAALFGARRKAAKAEAKEATE